MTLQQLANLFNITAIGGVLLVYVFVMRRHPALFFKVWAAGFACQMGIVSLELLASWVGRDLGLTLAQVCIATVGSSLMAQAGFLLRDRAVPKAVLWSLFAGVNGVGAALVVAGAPWICAMIPVVVLMSVATTLVAPPLLKLAYRGLGKPMAAEERFRIV